MKHTTLRWWIKNSIASRAVTSTISVYTTAKDTRAHTFLLIHCTLVAELRLSQKWKCTEIALSTDEKDLEQKSPSAWNCMYLRGTEKRPKLWRVLHIRWFTLLGQTRCGRKCSMCKQSQTNTVKFRTISLRVPSTTRSNDLWCLRSTGRRRLVYR
jgi:hypothetical protein